ncbi:hypothetical protein [uncultured Kordia sp.]|uniref:hypothetical protein n=1 Tax=uncultured Kordia sp. TaxID=507699 RepID=UPI0026195E0B|nr:hypothetical protein [uncultured Kordia sp.]
MKKERRQLQLRKFKVAKLTAYFLKGGTENVPEEQSAEVITIQASCATTTCTIGEPKTDINNDCGASGRDTCNVISG